MKQERAIDQFREAKLLSPENLDQLASRLKMVDPAPQQVQVLEGTTKHEARNRMPLGVEGSSN